ncbi:hypothetical protein [Lysinibacillus sp. fls2-241-R2A-57]|uniref:hypothetical protein n=1 Tax=Lysinibacillus sp. fls2-241-R2A-57 TaxID=3040292 RepID=UPI002553A320|nr:hypothetical protein [Lysinibacillus sp. fls2-241-R2A-57]
MSEFKLEISNDNNYLGLLEGDEVLVSTVEQPRSNGKDLAVFEAAGVCFVSTFTRFGNQIMLLGEHIRVVRKHQVKIIGKVIERSFEGKEKAVALADATAELIHAH